MKAKSIIFISAPSIKKFFVYVFVALMIVPFHSKTFAGTTANGPISESALSLTRKLLLSVKTPGQLVSGMQSVLDPEALKFLQEKITGYEHQALKVEDLGVGHFLFRLGKVSASLKFRHMSQEAGVVFEVNKRSLSFNTKTDTLPDLWERISKALPEKQISSLISWFLPQAYAQTKLPFKLPDNKGEILGKSFGKITEALGAMVVGGVTYLTMSKDKPLNNDGLGISPEVSDIAPGCRDTVLVNESARCRRGYYMWGDFLVDARSLEDKEPSQECKPLWDQQYSCLKNELTIRFNKVEAAKAEEKRKYFGIVPGPAPGAKDSSAQ